MALKISLENVQQIAGRCSEIDPSWYKSVQASTDPTQAIQECRANLERLAPRVNRVCAIYFDEVICRKWKHIEPLKRTLAIYPKNFRRETLENTVGFLELTVNPIDQGTSDFFLLHNERIRHIILDSTSPEFLDLSPRDFNSWYMTPEHLQKMTSQPWDGCFLNLGYLRAEVIPIPLSLPFSQPSPTPGLVHEKITEL